MKKQELSLSLTWRNNMGLIKTAVNAFTKNWNTLTNEAKIAIGKSGAIRSERKFLLGHIQGTKNIITDIKNKHNLQEIAYKPSKVMNTPAGALVSSNKGLIVNLDKTHQQLKDVLPQLGISTKIPKETSKSGRYLQSQIHRHESREIDAVANKIGDLNNKKYKGILEATGKLVSDTSLEEFPKKMKNLYRRKNIGEFNEKVLSGMVSGHHNMSIPLKDISESNKLPNNLGKTMLDMRNQEFPYRDFKFKNNKISLKDK